MSLKIITVLLTSSIILSPIVAHAATQVWTSQSDWGNWSGNQTSNTITSGSLTLSSSSTNWTAQSSPTSNNFSAMWGSSASNIIAVETAASAEAARYNGTSWSTESLPSMGFGYEDVHGASASSIWAVGSSGGIPTFINYNGSSWSEVATPLTGIESYPHGIGGSSSSDYWAVGSKWIGPGLGDYTNFILHNNGSGWSSVATPTTGIMDAVWSVDSSEAWAGGASGEIIHYNGSAWVTFSSPTSYQIDKIFGFSASDIWAVGANGTIIHYNGSSWSTVSSPTSNELYGIYGLDPSNIWAVGANGTIIHYNGSSWSTQTSGTGVLLSDVWGTSTTNLWVAGFSGTILKYNPVYNTPGYASVNFDGTNTYSEWQTVTKAETTNSQTIAYYGASDTDTSCPTAGAPWTGWTALSFSGSDADLTGLTHTRYLCLGVNLSTADTAVTPQVDALTLTYRQDTAPTVAISSPTSQTTYITNTTPITVAGSSSDSVGTLSSTTSSSGASNTGSAASWSFSEPLVEGDNALTYTATDSVTQTGTDSFTATLDTIDPVVTITSGTTSSTASYTLSGTATDTGGTGVASVAVSGASAGNGTASGTTSWSQTVTLATGANTITVTATDNATNTGSGSITVTYTPTPPPDEPCYWDSNTNNCADYFGTFTITAPNGGESYTVGSGDGEVTTASITWTYVSGSETADHVHLDYSTDGGVTYPNTITASTPVSPASYTWTLPTGVSSSTVKVKGVIEDSSNRQSSALDASDADFTIAQATVNQENCDLTAPTVADCGDDDTLWGTFIITAPNGSECFLTGVGLLIPSCLPTTVSTTTNITWEYTQGTIEADHLKLAYSPDNGITWYSITENTPLSPASYTWTLPTTSSTQMIISGTLTDSTGDTISSDSSNAPFTIRNNRAPEIRIK